MRAFCILAACFLTGLAGCGKSERPGEKTVFRDRLEDPQLHAAIEFVFEERTAKFYANEIYHDACDSEQKEPRTRIARDLDRHWPEISEFLPRSLPAQAPEPNSDGWTLKNYSWSKAISLHERIKNLGVNEQGQAWSELAQLAQLLTELDLRRAHGVQLPLGPGHALTAERIAQQFESCAANPNCQWPELLSDLDIPTRTAYFRHFKDLRATHLGRSSWRSKLARIALEVREYVNQAFSFQKQAAVTRDQSGALVAQLDAGQLGADREKIASSITRYWSSRKLPIRIDWVDQSQVPTAYKIILSPSLAAPAATDRENSRIYLRSAEDLKDLAHEFGHVLGFPDRYYRTWSADTCSYTEEKNIRDLMSSARTGRVPSKDIEKLLEEYPLPQN